MTGSVNAVRAKLDQQCLARSLSKDGCSLKQHGLPEVRIAIDLDNPFAPGDTTATRCDYLFLAQDGAEGAFAALIELKKGGFGATGVAKQIQAGANILAKLLPEHSTVRFHALVVSRKFPKPERRRFMRLRVRFRGDRHRLLHATCGSQLLSALNQ